MVVVLIVKSAPKLKIWSNLREGTSKRFETLIFQILVGDQNDRSFNCKKYSTIEILVKSKGRDLQASKSNSLPCNLDSKKKPLPEAARELWAPPSP